MTTESDIIILGGGIVGLATAYYLAQQIPDKSLVVLEKEAGVGRHQTSHNSGVLHSGVYYKPGSLKATNCRAGKKAMEEFCAKEGIPYSLCGKVIVATNDSELPRLQTLFERGRANGVGCEMIEPERLRELEPQALGIKALHIPEAGIVDYGAVCQRLAERVREKGGQVLTHAKVTALRENGPELIVETAAGAFRGRYGISCCGLHSDRVTALSGGPARVRIVPFRGEYYRLRTQAESLCLGLIYPVPDPQFPFLGVHFTRMIHGGVECGPNAVWAWAREGYRKTDINLRDIIESLAFPGFRKLAARHWRMGMEEMRRSFSKRAFLKALQRLVPQIALDDLEPGGAGVRAQAVAPDGAMVDDFAIEERGRMLHLINAPSPAATSALSIGRMIGERLLQKTGMTPRPAAP